MLPVYHENHSPSILRTIAVMITTTRLFDLSMLAIAHLISGLDTATGAWYQFFGLTALPHVGPTLATGLAWDRLFSTASTRGIISSMEPLNTASSRSTSSISPAASTLLLCRASKYALPCCLFPPM